MIKNHPFQNRNKRIAMTSLLVLLHRYDKWLKVDTQELYNFAVWVASSPSKLKDDVINAIEKFIGHVIVKLTK
ncbi:type II toxin-antitoxin system death-on-curing family toxin, partial [Patescibacteria group bacterium]|nr:type II toxin-antitoxin system death-on-curing family toxin [Patescibacteria group bacterium]MBU1890453.1 type II toxin-antitoxin system death-on-curing family toxin [Patescibacteria group bacterium]